MFDLVLLMRIWKWKLEVGILFKVNMAVPEMKNEGNWKMV